LIRGILGRRRARAAAALLPIKRAMLGQDTMVGVDVGSAGGMQPHWRAYEGLVDFYCFEPHDESRRKLIESFAAHPSSAKFHVIPTALSGAGGERTLYMLNSPTGSSLYPIKTGSEYVSPNDVYIYPIREARIQTRCLADVLDELAVKNVDMIKLDVQGAEMEVLNGLGSLRRKNLLLAEIEVNICGGVTRNFSPYEGAPSWSRIDEMLVADGMRLLDISAARAYRSLNGDGDWYQREVFDVYRNSPSISAHIWEADAVYVRDWRTLLEKRDAAAIKKLAIALCGYRFFSEAYFIVEKSEQAGVFEADSAADFKRRIIIWHRAGRRFWHGRERLWKFLRHGMRATGMSQLLRWKQYMWFDYPNG
jgi:FkbM family methyltransferase